MVATLLQRGGATQDGALLVDDKPSLLGGGAFYCSYMSYVLHMAQKLVSVNKGAAYRCLV